MKNILIYGVGTFKNRGVEAIVNSTINQIPKDYNLSIASFDLDYNKKHYSDRVNYVEHNRKDHLTPEEKDLEQQYFNMPFDYNNFELLYQGDVVKAMEESDLCISVGGDSYCYQPCNWLYALDNKSRKLNKKTVLWGSSLFEHIEDLDLINNLNNFDVLVIRESLTLNAIKDYVDPDKIIFVRDPAFSLKIKEIKLNNWYKNREFVILNVSPLTIKNDIQYKAVVDLMNYILKNTKYSICLLPHVTTDDCNDITILSKLKEEFSEEDRVFLEEDKYDCTELKYIISKSKLVVAARTHASIAGYSTCIPTLVIGYSVKAKGIAKDLFGEYENYVINSKDLTSERLIEKYKFIEKNSSKIIKTLEEQMPQIKEDTAHIFDRVIEKLKEQEKKTICEKRKCIGCGVCSEVCPVNAITMKENKEGYLYPEIDLDKCIHCNKCRKSCPINKELKIDKFDKKVYALKSKNKKEVKESTSGGAFSVLARKVLKEKGIVYGVEMQNNNACHIRISNEKDLIKIRGSKYIQSSLFNVFKELKKDLEKGKKVLFSGTPCQIGAVKALVGKDNKNLITVSVVCHGIMSKKLLEKHLQGIENEANQEVTNWRFRTKENNDWHTSSISYNLGTTKIIKSFMQDDLMYLYLKDVVERESCYNCKFKGDNNTADLIVGDYWGIEISHPEFFDDTGVSQLIINSKKGEKLFKSINIEKECEVLECDYEDVEKYNPLFIRSINRPLVRNISLLDIDDKDFTDVSSKLKNTIMLKDYEKLQRESNNLRLEIDRLTNELDSIYNSKRWKVVDKSVNTINKIIGKK